MQFKFAEIFINHANTGSWKQPPISQVNYVLTSTGPMIYTAVFSWVYKKPEAYCKINFAYNSSADIDTVISFIQNLYINRVQHPPAKAILRHSKMQPRLQQQDQLEIRHAKQQMENLLAAVLLFKDETDCTISFRVTKKGKMGELFLYDIGVREFCK